MSESNNKNQNAQPSSKEDSNINKRATSERIESLRNSDVQKSHDDEAKPSNTSSTNFNNGATEQSKNSEKEFGKDKKDQRRETIGLRSFAKNIIFT